MTTKRTKPAELGALAAEQAADASILERIAARLSARLEELAQPSWSETGRREERTKALADAQKKAEGIGARMRARVAEAGVALQRWDPSARRLAAALEQPLEAAALVQRLARVPAAALRPLAEDAAARGDWLLADVVAMRTADLAFGPEGKDPQVAEITEGIQALLAGMESAPRKNVQAEADAIGESFAQARVYLAMVDGKPLTSRQLVELGFQHGTRNRTPAGVL